MPSCRKSHDGIISYFIHKNMEYPDEEIKE